MVDIPPKHRTNCPCVFPILDCIVSGAVFFFADALLSNGHRTVCPKCLNRSSSNKLTGSIRHICTITFLFGTTVFFFLHLRFTTFIQALFAVQGQVVGLKVINKIKTGYRLSQIAVELQASPCLTRSYGRWELLNTLQSILKSASAAIHLCCCP